MTFLLITTEQERVISQKDVARFYPINDIGRLCVVYDDGRAVTVDTTGRVYSAQRPFAEGDVEAHNEVMRGGKIQAWRLVQWPLVPEGEIAPMTCRKCAAVNPFAYYAPAVLQGAVTCVCEPCAIARQWITADGCIREGVEL